MILSNFMAMRRERDEKKNEKAAQKRNVKK
jgi:hypothetical protein